MLVIERQKKIKELLQKNKSVRVSELEKEFDVSKETIRRDLNKLEEEGLIQKNYGGAVLVEDFPSNHSILPIRERQRQFYAEKELIGQRAAEFIKSNQTLIIDAGSTTWHVARSLKSIDHLMIITNAMNIAEECTRNESNSIYLLGGKIRRNSLSTVGPQAEEELQKYSANCVFLGASGISLRQGFTSSDLYEANMKKAMVLAGQKRIVLADHSKLKRAGLTSFCQFEEVDVFITSDLADENVLREIEKLGVQIIVVSTEGITDA